MSRSHSAHRQAKKKKDPYHFKKAAKKRVSALLNRKNRTKEEIADNKQIPDGIEFVEEFK